MAQSPLCGMAALLLINGCGAAAGPGASGMHVEARPAGDDQKLVVAQAISPLLIAFGYTVERTTTGIRLRGDCKIALGIVKSKTINAAISPGWMDPCVHFELFLTEGALQTLPPGEMMALLAHELAHVHLGHLTRPGAPRPTPPQLASAMDSTVGLIVAFTDPQLIIDGPASRFGSADESDADQVAARMLSRVGQRTACLGLVTLLDRLVGGGEPSGAWLSTHPPPARRVRQARTLCDGGEPLARPGGVSLR